MDESAKTGPRWIAVAAMAGNRVIGKDGELPWRLPEDLKFFKELTVGGTILMGRKTFASIGRPLPRRRNLVLSRSDRRLEGAETFPDLPAATAALSPGETVFVIGGAEIYRQTLPYWDEVYLTLVEGSFEGDTFLPPFEARFPPPEIVREGRGFRVERYRAGQWKSVVARAG
jgi:dihydrofolate reductase